MKLFIVIKVIKMQNLGNDDVSYVSVLRKILSKDQSKCECNLAYHVMNNTI